MGDFGEERLEMVVELWFGEDMRKEYYKGEVLGGGKGLRER